MQMFPLSQHDYRIILAVSEWFARIGLLFFQHEFSIIKVQVAQLSLF